MIGPSSFSSSLLRRFIVVVGATTMLMGFQQLPFSHHVLVDATSVAETDAVNDDRIGIAHDARRKLDSAFVRTTPAPSPLPTTPAPTPFPTPQPTWPPTSPTTLWPTRHPTNRPTNEPTWGWGTIAGGRRRWSCGSLETYAGDGEDGEESCVLGPYQKLSLNMEPREFACNDGDGKWFSKSYHAPSFMFSFTLTQQCQYMYRDPTRHEQDVEVRDVNAWFDAAAIKFKRVGHSGYKVSDDNIGFTGWHVPDYLRDLYKTKNAGEDSTWCPEDYCVLVDGPSIGTLERNYADYGSRRRRRTRRDLSTDITWELQPDYHVVEGLDAIQDVASDETSAGLLQILRRNREVKVSTLDVAWSGDIWLPSASEVRTGTKVQFECGIQSEFTVHFNDGESVHLIDYSSLTNVALGKTATQSSNQYINSADASEANDGVTDNYSKTGYDEDPFWEVDLNEKHYIKEIKVWNRVDCCEAWLGDFVVEIYQGSNITWSSVPYEGTPPRSTKIDVPNIAGDKVRISRTGRRTHLQIAEVEIFGMPWPPATFPSTVRSNSSSNEDSVLLLTVLEDVFDIGRKLWFTENTYVSDENKYEAHTAEDSAFHAGLSTTTNVALGKVATHTSTRYNKEASNAVDGDPNSYSSTNNVENAAWEVDLHHTYYIKEIKVWNRPGCCQERLRGFVVEIYRGSNITWFTEPYEGTPPVSTTFDVPNIIGDAVRITIPGRQAYLDLGEVEIFGASPSTENQLETTAPRDSLELWNSLELDDTFLSNVALGKIATQSSTSYSNVASKAVDGNNGCCSYSRTINQYEPFWEVDLQQKHYIKMIKVWNVYYDRNRERLRGFVVEIYQGSLVAWSSEPYEGTPPRENTIDVPNIIGDKVRVSIPGRDGLLELYQVEVFGTTISTEEQYASIGSWEPNGSELVYAFSHKDAAQDFYKMMYDTMRSNNNGHIYSTNFFLKCGCESFCLDAIPPNPEATCYVEDVCGVTVFKIAYPDHFPDDEKVNWFETGTTDVMEWFSACAYGQFRCDVHPNSQFESFEGIDPTSDRDYKFPKETLFNQYNDYPEVYGLGGVVMDGFTSANNLETDSTTNATVDRDYLINVALGKTATQSSTRSGNSASRAIDGDTDNYIYTNREYDPFWEVDLQQKHFIKEIKVWNRMDWGQERLRGFVVEIYLGSNITWSSEPHEGTPPETTTIDVPNNTVGDKVKISIPGQRQYLQLAEVEVFGYVQPHIMWTCPGRTERDRLYEFGKIIEQTGFMRGDYKKPTKSVPIKPCEQEIIDPPEEPELPSPVGPDCQDVDDAGYCMRLSGGTCFVRRPTDSCYELDFVIETTADEPVQVFTDVEEWMKTCIGNLTECTLWNDSTGEMTYKGGPKVTARIFDDVAGWILTLSNRLVNGQDTMKNGEIIFDCTTWEAAYEAKNLTDGAADRYRAFGNSYGDLFGVDNANGECTDEPTNYPTEVPTLSSQPSGFPTSEPTVCAESYLNSENLNIALVVDLSFSTYEKTFSSEVDIGDVNGDGKGNTILDAQVVAIQDLLMSIAESPTLNNSNTEIALISFETDSISHGVWPPLQSEGDAFNQELMNYIKQELRAPIKNDTIDEVRELNNGYTNFDAALDRSVEYFKESATPHRLNLMVFLSDGEPNVRGDGDAEMYCTDTTTFWNDDNPGTEYDCSDLGLQPGERHTSCRGNDRNCVDNNRYQDCVRGPNFCFFSDAVQQYDSELAELDGMNVARLAIGVGDESNVTEGSALWVIDDNPGKEQGILPERVLTLEELSSALKHLCILNTDPPTGSPSATPTASPTASPAPSKSPTGVPSVPPTGKPSGSPTDIPEFVMATSAPTPVPSKDPTDEGAVAESPTGSPTVLPDCYDGPKLIETDDDSASMCYFNRDMVQVNEMNINNVTIAINNVWTADVLPQQVQVFVHAGDVGDIRNDGDGFQCMDEEGTDIDVEGENELNVRCYQEEPGNATSPYLATIDVVISDPNIHGSSNGVPYPCLPDLTISEACSWRLIIPCNHDEMCTEEPTTSYVETTTVPPIATFSRIVDEPPPPEPKKCPKDVTVKTVKGVTAFDNDWIRIISQDMTTVSVELSQSFTAPSSSIDNIFYQYHTSHFDKACLEEKDVSGGATIDVTIVCTVSSPVAFLDVWVVDDVDKNVLSIGDDATVPKCCHPGDDVTAEGKPVSYYVLEIACISSCPEEGVTG